MRLVPLTDMDEYFVRDRQEIWLDPDAYAEDPELAVTHALAHLDLGHLDCDGAMFTDEQEDQADFYADVRLDRASSR